LCVGVFYSSEDTFRYAGCVGYEVTSGVSSIGGSTATRSSIAGVLS